MYKTELELLSNKVIVNNINLANFCLVYVYKYSFDIHVVFFPDFEWT